MGYATASLVIQVWLFLSIDWRRHVEFGGRILATVASGSST